MIRKISFFLLSAMVIGFSFSVLTAQQSVFQLEIAEGGGYTGSVRGYTIASSGKVTYWQKLGSSDTVLSVSTLPVNEIEKLSDLLKADGMPSSGYTMSGNITRVMTIKSDDGTKSWTWCPYMSAVSPQAKTLNEVYKKILHSVKAEQ